VWNYLPCGYDIGESVYRCAYYSNVDPDYEMIGELVASKVPFSSLFLFDATFVMLMIGAFNSTIPKAAAEGFGHGDEIDSVH
jgi:hypothetical protein